MRNTKISWCDSTFNPWIGCSEVSDGCKHCYARGLALRMKKAQWGDQSKRILTSPDNWKQPNQWNKKTDHKNVHRVFCGSMMDWLDDKAPVEWLARLLEVIAHTPNLTWLLLTKRPENFIERLSGVISNSSGTSSEFAYSWLEDKKSPNNVWIGASIENQKMADQRCPSLLKIPSVMHFVSCEPLLGPVELYPWLVSDYDRACMDEQLITPLVPPSDYYNKIRWVITGGESGFNHRKMEISWMEDLAYAQCQEAGCSFFCKQDSSRFPGQQGNIPNELWQIKQFPES